MRIATMWDDGLVGDLRIIEILRKFGGKASFAISPSMHGVSRSLNDPRSEKYGERVSAHELKEFSDFEVVNHTYSHFDLAKCDKKTTEMEIRDGQRCLEDIFQRSVRGFCYPFGVSNQFCQEVLHVTHDYARTTYGWPRKKPVSSRFFIHPDCKWNHPDILSLVTNGCVFVWGHSYEIYDWEEFEKKILKLSEIADFVAFCDVVNQFLHQD